MMGLFRFARSLDYRIKFLIVGGMNTAVGIGVYWLVLICFGVNITKNDAAAHAIIIATASSQIVGVIHSYLWNKFFTFQSKQKSHTEMLRFLMVYAVVFATEYGLKFALTAGGVNQIGVAIISTCVIMVISFIGQKVFVFKMKKGNKGNI